MNDWISFADDAGRGFSQEKVAVSIDPHPMSALIHSNVDTWMRAQYIRKRLVMQGGWFLP